MPQYNARAQRTPEQEAEYQRQLAVIDRANRRLFVAECLKEGISPDSTCTPYLLNKLKKREGEEK